MKVDKSKTRSGWRAVELDEICEIRLGKMLSPASKLGLRPVPYLRNVNVQWDRFDLSDVAEMDFDERQEAILALRPGDLLVCEGGEPGRAAVWEGQIARCCYQKALHRLRPLNEAVDPRFLMYRLWLGGKQNEFTSSNAKTTIAHLPAIRLAKLSVMLPEIAEQRRIAKQLREQIMEVERARAAVQAQLDAAQTLPAALSRAIFTSPAAQRWPRRRLGDLLEPRNDIVHPRNRPSGTATFVGLEHIEPNTGRRIGSIEIDKAVMTGRKAQFFKGDVVYGYLRPYLNKVWIAEFDGLCSVDQYVYEVNSKLAATSFLVWFMRSSTYLERAPIGGSPGQLPRIRMDEVAATEINLPSLADQNKIAARLDAELVAARALFESLETRLAEIELLPTTLLRSAFNGN